METAQGRRGFRPVRRRHGYTTRGGGGGRQGIAVLPAESPESFRASESPMIDGRSFTPWFCLCPLLAIARGWREAFVLSAALLACVVVTAGLLASMRGKVWS